MFAVSAVVLAAACHGAGRARPATPALHRRGQSAGAVALSVVRSPTVVSFWLASADTLDSTSAAEARSDFEYYTAHAADFLAEQEIALVGTTADTIIVELPGGGRRTIMLTGLDYPFGYVLVQPGYAERILTGISTDEELEDEASSYFDVGDEGDDGVVAGWKRKRAERVTSVRSEQPEAGSHRP
jgi:hypothetical protein